MRLVSAKNGKPPALTVWSSVPPYVFANSSQPLLHFQCSRVAVLTKKRLDEDGLLADETQQKTQETDTDNRTKRLSKKKSWGSRLLKCCSKDRDTSDLAIPVQVSPAKLSLSASLKEELKDLKETSLFEEERVKAVLQGLRSSLSEKSPAAVTLLKPIDSFGFPNIGQSCYMNSSLQSLLALEEFIGDIVSMQKVWSFVPEAQLMRTLVDIKRVHTSTDPQRKRLLLFSFKKTISDQAPVFGSNLQNDAYEFLTTVLAHMRGLSPLLHKVASHLGTCYTCPVESHLVFKMDIMRTCKSCDIRSLRQEEFTNLSLDLVPEATVEQMLQLYLTETQLEYKCNCGGTESGQRFSFATLPEVLLLHLKRFRCTPVCKLEKAYDPIRLPANMVVYTGKGNVQYSLISSISHFGVLELGHYICDSVHPGKDQGKSSDRWLTFNDSQVHETSGSDICKERQRTAYILFYKKQGVQERWTDEPYQDVET